MKASLLPFGLLALALVAGPLGYQAATAGVNGHPSAKATAKVGGIHLVTGPTVSGQEAGPWQTILENTLKTANNKDLFMGVSLECGLFTSTLVRSKGGNKDTSRAEAQIEVRVLVDGVEAQPGPVVFARRMQELSATLQGLIDGALSVDPDTGQVIIDENLLQPEEIETILDTMDANHFNFVISDLGSGVHRVEVQARVELAANAVTGEAVAKATVGKGSLTVEEVRLIKNEDILLD